MTKHAEIAARLKAATPGPWHISKDSPVVVIIPRAGANDYDWRFDSGDRAGAGTVNADFIAHAPSDIAWLLNRVAELEARNGP